MSLDQIAADPMVATSLDVADRATLITRCASVLAALSASLLSTGDQRKAPAGAEAVPGEKLMTVREVAQLLGFTPGYVYELCRTDELHAMHRGKYWRVRACEVARFIEAHEKNPPGLDCSKGQSDVSRANLKGSRLRGC
jgi:excisionase family DNA binding protein